MIAEFEDALSPRREAAAYEALWDSDNATVKTIAEKVFFSNFINKIAFNKKLMLESTEQSNEIYKILSSLVDDSIINIYYDNLQIRTNKCKDIYGVKFIGEADYPEKLLDAKYPAPLLYYCGKWDLAFSNCVAVVGTRNPTKDGIKRTQQLVKHLVRDNYTITSGLASGIDTTAHNAAIMHGGNTIAVIGTPIDEVYPKDNKELQKKIANEHLLISQVPFIKYKHQDYRKNRFFFPERNKTMSAMTLATVIVEAGETSGSLIQAKAALEQGRLLFILDSCFQNNALTWPDKYLKIGAIRVRDYTEIKSELEKVARNKNEEYDTAY